MWNRRHSNGWECTAELVTERYVAMVWPHDRQPNPGTDHATAELAQAVADASVQTESQHRCDSGCTPWSRVGDSSN